MPSLSAWLRTMVVVQWFSVFTVMTAALWVVSYSIVTVVDLACDAMLQAAYGQDSC